ncbi:MAG TPA: SprT family zinc-dependent metalloprotease [Nitrososphaera sp.]|nr:SprT family zinc-dependent metalloprotease [Nitrososphaera sp.]
MSLSVVFNDNMAIRIDICQNKRTKRFRLVSGINGVRAIVPLNYNIKELENFITSKRNWILRTSQYYGKLKERNGGLQPYTLYFLGSKYKFRIVKDRWPLTVVSDTIKLITFHVTDRRRYKQHIQEWYKQQTYRIIADRLPILAGRFNVKYNKVSVKNQKSRWASCSKNGNLHFNLLLAAAPSTVIDYVMIHELMHLIEFDHSLRFWQLVKEADPDYMKHREWLLNYASIIKVV